MADFRFTVTNPRGLDARLAGMLVTEAAKCSGRVTIYKGEKTGDAMSIFNVLSLSVKCNDEVKITVEGENEKAEADKLEAFMRENFE